MARLAALALLGAILPALPAQAQDKPDCTNQMDQSTMTACAQQDAEAAQADLDSAYAAALARATVFDTENEPDREGNPFINSEPMAILLKRSQDGWSAYRDTTCEMEPDSIGGSMYPAEVANCLEEMSLERIIELEILFTDDDGTDEAPDAN